jgi:ribosomal-protein-alanine N-acetyltransferase
MTETTIGGSRDEPSPMLLHFRNFEHDDLFEVVRLANRSLNESYDGGLFLQLGDLYPEGFIVCESQQGIEGFLLGVVERAYEARILILAVDERARGKGIGARLVKLFEERFLHRAIRRVNLEVRIHNENAIRLYEKLGFEKRKVLPRYYADGEDAYLMTKLIA